MALEASASRRSDDRTRSHRRPLPAPPRPSRPQERLLGARARLARRGVRRHRHQPALRLPRGALDHARARRSAAPTISASSSLVLWALIMVVTVKYVLFLMRADNKGEGGVLSLMALAQRAIGRRTRLLFFLGVVGAALFYGDARHHPGDLGAVGGRGPADASRSIGHSLDAAACCRSASASWSALFMVQARGTAARGGASSGRSCCVWFLTIGGARACCTCIDDPRVLLRAQPATTASRFLIDNGFVGFVVLGSGVPDRDRRRGALRRHGPLRPLADPGGLAVPGASRAWRSTISARARWR